MIPNMFVRGKLVMHFGDLFHVAPRANCSYDVMLRHRAMVSVSPTRKFGKFSSTCLAALFRKHGVTGTLAAPGS